MNNSDRDNATVEQLKRDIRRHIESGGKWLPKEIGVISKSKREVPLADSDDFAEKPPKESHAISRMEQWMRRVFPRLSSMEQGVVMNFDKPLRDYADEIGKNHVWLWRKRNQLRRKIGHYCGVRCNKTGDLTPLVQGE